MICTDEKEQAHYTPIRIHADASGRCRTAEKGRLRRIASIRLLGGCVTEVL